MILQDQVKIFCYSGLIPFIFIPIVSWISPKIAFDYYLILFFFAWSIMMATFMAGTLWGLSIKSNESILSSIITFSLVFLLSLFIMFSAENYLILCLFALLLIYEYIHFSERRLIEKIEWYKEIRFHLTFSIRICHLLMIGFIFTNQ